MFSNQLLQAIFKDISNCLWNLKWKMSSEQIEKKKILSVNRCNKLRFSRSNGVVFGSNEFHYRKLCMWKEKYFFLLQKHRLIGILLPGETEEHVRARKVTTEEKFQ